MTRCARLALLAIALTLPASARSQAVALTPVQLREDLAWFRRDVFPVEQSYTPAARAEGERRLAKLEGSLATVTPLAFEMEIARIVALADNGHSSVFAPNRARRANRVPLRFATFGDEFRVVRASSSNADLLGARLVAIDGRSIAVVRDSVRTLFGGVAAWRDRHVPLVLESPAQLNVLGIARVAGAAEYSFVTDEGRPVTRRIVAEASGRRDVMQSDQLLYGPSAPLDADWSAVKPASVPWTLADPMTAFRWRAAPEIDAMVIQLRRVVDGPGQSIREFLSAVVEKVRAEHPRNLVVDMRLNGGGNLQLAHEFMKGLPELVPGRVFVITGPSTFSAAISSVGYLKQSAPARVRIVGEEVGDRLVFFAEGQPGFAQHSGMVIGRATQRHDYQNGCKAFTDCHGYVVRFPIAVPTLKPDLPAPLTFADWKAGRDPAMEAILAAVRR